MIDEQLPVRSSVPTRDLPAIGKRFEVRVLLTVLGVALVPLVALLVLRQGVIPVSFLLFATVPAGVLSWWVARGITRRVRLLAMATARVAQGDLSVRVRPRGNDEVDDLMRAFNAMVEEMQTSRTRIEYLQRISAWQDFAQRLAHEIKNPLTPIQLVIQELARRYQGDDASFARSLETAREVIEEEVEALRRLVVAFTNFARLPDVRLTTGDLAEFVCDVRDSAGYLDEAAAGVARRADVRIVFQPGEGAVPVMLDRHLLRRLLDNLVRNAVEAGANTVWVRAESHDAQAWLLVEDDGPGIAADQREKVFDPYFTTRPEGTGLGLAMVRKIALEHRGDVGIESREPNGARFVVTMPKGTEPARPGHVSYVTFSGTGTPST